MEENKKELPQDKLELIKQNFPPEAITQHPTKTFLTSIKAQYVIERLNDVFGVGGWEARARVIVATAEDIVVEVKLSFGNWDLLPVMQYGGAKIKTKSELGDNYKSAKTDGLTKCASIIGIGESVFKGLVKSSGVTTSVTPAIHIPTQPVNSDGMVCDICGAPAAVSKAGNLYCSNFKTHEGQFGNIISKNIQEFTDSLPVDDCWQ